MESTTATTLVEAFVIVEMCAHCKKPIQPPDDTVKVSESARVARSFGKPIYQQYAHAKCYKQKSSAKASGT